VGIEYVLIVGVVQYSSGAHHNKTGYGSIKLAGAEQPETAHHSFLGCIRSDCQVGKHINTKSRRDGDQQTNRQKGD
jgi:hypothetical protein